MFNTSLYGDMEKFSPDLDKQRANQLFSDKLSGKLTTPVYINMSLIYNLEPSFIFSIYPKCFEK